VPVLCFNPGLGFRSVATWQCKTSNIAYRLVSIPVWVFGPSRPPPRYGRHRADRCFNPGLGFRSVATAEGYCTLDDVVSIPVWVFGPSRPGRAASEDGGHAVFQSRSGFSVRRDRVSRSRTAISPTGFNPGLGFRSVATVRNREVPGLVRDVSIPVWVFGPSRQLELPTQDNNFRFQSRSGFSVRRDPFRADQYSEQRSFNPGLGFRSVATAGDRPARRPWIVVSIPVWVFGPSRRQCRCRCIVASAGFNPGLGFRSVATRWAFRRARAAPAFQSRSGFSVRRDARQDWFVRLLLVSIPVWVFGPSRPSRNAMYRYGSIRFQSRSGFSVRRDSAVASPLSWVTVSFNPGLGFRSVATVTLRTAGISAVHVSIPVWVFGPSRPTTAPQFSRGHRVVSIPVWVFGPSRLDGLAAGLRPEQDVSIPVWVFGPSRRQRSRR